MDYKATLDEMFEREGVEAVYNYFTKHEKLSNEMARNKLIVMGYAEGTLTSEEVNISSVSQFNHTLEPSTTRDLIADEPSFLKKTYNSVLSKVRKLLE